MFIAYMSKLMANTCELKGAPRKIKKIKLIGFNSIGYSAFVDELTRVANTLPPDCVSHEQYMKIAIDPASDDYKSVSKRFTDAKLPDMELVCIYKIKAPHLETKFNAHKNQLKNQYKLHKEIKNALEREVVFHGTSQKIVTKILAGGFNPKFGAQDPERTMHGQGCYFARDLVLSAHDHYSVPNEDGHKFIFIARLLTGATFNVFQLKFKI